MVLQRYNSKLYSILGQGDFHNRANKARPFPWQPHPGPPQGVSPARHPNHLVWLPSMWRGCSLAPGSASVTHWGCQKNYRETTAKIGFMFSFLFCRHSWEVRLAKNHFPENKKTIYGVRGQTNLQGVCICCVVHAVIQQHNSPHTSIYTLLLLYERWKEHQNHYNQHIFCTGQNCSLRGQTDDPKALWKHSHHH